MTRTNPKTVDTRSAFLNALLARLWFALLVHWLFQGMLQMDPGERTIKLGVTSAFAALVVMAAEPSALWIAAAVLIGHTANFALFGQVNVVLKNFGISRANRGKLHAYVKGLAQRVRENPGVEYAAIYGSISRGDLSDTSDLDVRFVRSPGFRALIVACALALVERLRATLVGVPLDLLVLDSREGLSRMRSDEHDGAVILKAELSASKEHPLVVVVPYMVDMTAPTMGGGIRYVLNLIDGIGRLEPEVRFRVLGVRAPGHGSQLPPANVEFIPVTAESSFVSYFFALLWLLIRRRTAVTGATVIHSHRTYFSIPFMLLFPRIPVVQTLHSRLFKHVEINYPWAIGTLSAAYGPIDRAILRRCRSVICVSEYVKEGYGKYRDLAAKMHVIPTSVDSQAFCATKKNIADDVPTILFLGRLEAEKRVSTLIRAMAHVCKQLPSAQLLIAGDGSHAFQLRRLAEQVGIASNVTFLGRVAPNAVPAFFARGHVLALTSEYEGAPTVVRESLAAGVPVVSTDVGDVRLLLAQSDDVEAVGSIAPSDPAEFAAVLVKQVELAVREPARVREAARRLARAHSTEAVAHRVLGIYRLAT